MHRIRPPAVSVAQRMASVPGRAQAVGPMKLAPDDSQGSPWPSPASGDPAGPVGASRWRSRTGIRGDELRAAMSRWSKYALTT
jgi:hypothetical protein